jgi:fructoselysine-6-P-deglycase FrlB-like protein
VKRPYRSEIDALDATYAGALDADVGALRAAVHALGSGPALFIGSGGSMALAELAARLHERVCRQPGQARTSLQALDAPQLGRRGALLFSSSAKHPDAQRVLADFGRRRFTPAVLVTHRHADDVCEFAGCDTRIVTLAQPVQPDGFLATGSIVQIATQLTRAYLPSAQLPSALPDAEVDAALRDEVLVLTPPSLICVATRHRGAACRVGAGGRAGQ